MTAVWVNTNAAVPRFVLQFIPIDHQERVLIMHRSPNVRSIPNVWSFPSGIQEIGEPWPETCSREMEEEYGLEIEKMNAIGVYENIAGDDPSREQWHWVILLVGVRVRDVTQAINKEPEKHDKLEFIPLDTLSHDDFLFKYPFHKSFDRFFRESGGHIVNKLLEVARCDIKQ